MYHCTTYIVYITHHLTGQLVHKTISTLANIFLSLQTAGWTSLHARSHSLQPRPDNIFEPLMVFRYQ